MAVANAVLQHVQLELGRLRQRPQAASHVDILTSVRKRSRAAVHLDDFEADEGAGAQVPRLHRPAERRRPQVLHHLRGSNKDRQPVVCFAALLSAKQVATPRNADLTARALRNFPQNMSRATFPSEHVQSNTTLMAHLVAAGNQVVRLQRHLLRVLKACRPLAVHTAQRQHVPLGREVAAGASTRSPLPPCSRNGCRPSSSSPGGDSLSTARQPWRDTHCAVFDAAPTSSRQHGVAARSAAAARLLRLGLLGVAAGLTACFRLFQR